MARGWEDPEVAAVAREAAERSGQTEATALWSLALLDVAREAGVEPELLVARAVAAARRRPRGRPTDWPEHTRRHFEHIVLSDLVDASREAAAAAPRGRSAAVEAAARRLAGDAPGAEVLASCRHLASAIVERHRGRVVHRRVALAVGRDVLRLPLPNGAEPEVFEALADSAAKMRRKK